MPTMFISQQSHMNSNEEWQLRIMQYSYNWILDYMYCINAWWHHWNRIRRVIALLSAKLLHIKIMSYVVYAYHEESYTCLPHNHICNDQYCCFIQLNVKSIYWDSAVNLHNQMVKSLPTSFFKHTKCLHMHIQIITMQ